ncbi:MAG: beta-ketoacyl-[acyl-carrier-protein] synthase family protein [Treponemataceae bacterium]|nr:beta-ketoacyl-[acyl-carrier-protein] synthase family protein [Treponemataceae bacterium]
MKTIDVMGIGVVTAAGLGIKENWENLLMGKSCIGPIKDIDVTDLQTKNAGQIYRNDDELRELIKEKVGGLRSDSLLPAERSELFLFLAFEEARQDAGISREELQRKKVGIFVGTSLAGFTRLEKDYQKYIQQKKHIRPSSYLTYPLNVCVDRLAYEYGISGPRYLFSTACSASLHAVFLAREMLCADLIDIAIIGGTEPLSLMSLGGFSSLKSLAIEKCSPFSTTELGISIGEGAGVIIAVKNGKGEKYASILNIGGSSDAYHPTASNPTGETIRISITKAFEGVKIEGHDLYIMSHGTGTSHNDMVETRAIKQIEPLKNAYVSAAKSVIGHTLGASGIIELVYLIKALSECKAVPIASFSEPRPGCDLKYVSPSVVSLNNPVGLKNAFAFGGNNVTVLVGPKNIVAENIQKVEKSPVVITGIGIVSPANVFSNEEIIEKIKEGKPFIHDIKPIRGYNSSFSVSRAALIDDNALDNICKKLRIKNARKMDRISLIACVAASLAIKDSEYKITTTNNNKIGIVSATATGALGAVSEFYTKMLEKGVKSADANVFPNTVVNAHVGYISIELNIKGYSTVIAQGNSSAYAALQTAISLLESDMCDSVLVGSVSEYSEAYFRSLIDIGNLRNSKEQDSYAKDINGNVFSEGGVFFVIEKQEQAIKRGAKIRAIIDKVEVGSDVCLPSKFRMVRNPLARMIEEYHKAAIIPSCIAGEGSGLESENRMEYEAFRLFPHVPKTSASSYFGMANGVVPFYNLALFCLFSQSNYIPGVTHWKDTCYDSLVRGLYQAENIEDIIIGSISAGGVAGTLYAKKAIL